MWLDLLDLVFLSGEFRFIEQEHACLLVPLNNRNLSCIMHASMKDKKKEYHKGIRIMKESKKAEQGLRP